MAVNIQLQQENNPQKQLCAGKSEIPLFYNRQHLSPPLSCYNLCKGLKLKHSLSVYFLWVVGESSAQLRSIGF